MLASISSRMPSSTNGSRRRASSFWATAAPSPAARRAGAARRTRRRRGGRRCRTRAARAQPARDLLEQQVAHVVAERVVDLLEVVEVHDHHHGRLAAAARRVTAWSMRSRKSSRFGQAGEGVVQRLVLLGDRVAAAAVHGVERQEQQGDGRQEKSAASRTTGARPSSRPPVGDRVEEVARRGSAGPSCAGRARSRRRRRPCSRRRTSPMASITPSRSLGSMCGTPERGMSVVSFRTAPDAATVIASCARLKADFLSSLRRCTSTTTLAMTSAISAASGPPASSAANMKHVEVVISPSAPRVKTLSGRKSPISAQIANSAISGVRTRESRHAVEHDPDTAHRADQDDGGDVRVQRVGFDDAGDHFTRSRTR